jgi:hypothetical protein
MWGTKYTCCKESKQTRDGTGEEASAKQSPS